MWRKERCFGPKTRPNIIVDNSLRGKTAHFTVAGKQRDRKEEFRGKIYPPKSPPPTSSN
jgi:hypothetical protein